MQAARIADAQDPVYCRRLFAQVSDRSALNNPWYIDPWRRKTTRLPKVQSVAWLWRVRSGALIGKVARAVLTEGAMERAEKNCAQNDSRFSVARFEEAFAKAAELS